MVHSLGVLRMQEYLFVARGLRVISLHGFQGVEALRDDSHPVVLRRSLWETIMSI